MGKCFPGEESGGLLRTAIKLEKEHSYGSPKAALAAQVALEEAKSGKAFEQRVRHPKSIRLQCNGALCR